MTGILEPTGHLPGSCSDVTYFTYMTPHSRRMTSDREATGEGNKGLTVVSERANEDWDPQLSQEMREDLLDRLERSRCNAGSSRPVRAYTRACCLSLVRRGQGGSVESEWNCVMPLHCSRNLLETRQRPWLPRVWTQTQRCLPIPFLPQLRQRRESGGGCGAGPHRGAPLGADGSPWNRCLLASGSLRAAGWSARRHVSRFWADASQAPLRPAWVSHRQ